MTSTTAREPCCENEGFEGCGVVATKLWSLHYHHVSGPRAPKRPLMPSEALPGQTGRVFSFVGACLLGSVLEASSPQRWGFCISGRWHGNCVPNAYRAGSPGRRRSGLFPFRLIIAKAIAQASKRR